ncbi:MAG: polyprenyl synthetase family protein [Cyanobacteria bacterium J06649_4]
MVTTNLDSPPAFDLKAYLSDRAQQVEAALDASLPVVYPEKIYEAMRYSLMAGGKRLRPILCLATCDMLEADPQIAMPTACALEMVHTMSLIHDDLPAMDNDDYRRGKLTNHKVYGEDVAVLAGDALLTYAFEYIATQTKGASPQDILTVIAQLSKAVGAAGLVGGQIVDLASEGTVVNEETLTFIHMHKTAALLEVSVTSGAVLAGAEQTVVNDLKCKPDSLGVASQLVDDGLLCACEHSSRSSTCTKQRRY